jgi:3-methyladenine DNA glycosylase/8-oxoguanine DNA glycosylase
VPGETVFRLPIAGAGGEPVDLRRTFLSHGFGDLPPMALDRGAHALEVTVPVAGGRPRTLWIAPADVGWASVRVGGGPVGPRVGERLRVVLRHILRLDEDLSAFYAAAQGDPELAWACGGAGRMIRSPTVFEDVVKTICTTNCSWALTRKMVGTLVERLGAPAPGAPERGWRGRGFPSAEAMARAPRRFYRDVVRAGYRGPYLRAVARAAADGSADLEALARSGSSSLSDDEVAERLVALPGVGPYAAAHIMMLLGRYSRLTLDSWTRPAYAKLRGRRRIADRTIVRDFRGYGAYAGLAFWLFLTRSWLERDGEEPET